MGVNNSWRTQHNMNDWMRNMEKRLMHEERRPAVAPAFDVVGPGISTYSQQVEDWNSEGPVVNGFFYSTASQVVNSPDDEKNWMGLVQSNEDGQGLQRVWEYIDTAEEPSVEPALYTRAFVTNEDGTRTYTEWLLGGGSGGGGTDLAVYDETTLITAVASRINFKGDGVVATLAAAGQVDVTIAGGGGGGAPTGPAGGDLTGTYPNPSIGTGVIVDTDVHINNKDGGAAIPSMRTLGTGAQQAAAGNHRHTLSHIDAGGVLSSPLVE